MFFVKEKGLNPVVISSLLGIAASQLSRRIMDIYKDEDEGQFFHLVSLAQKIIPFSVKISLDLDKKIKNDCHMQMGEQLIRLQKTILFKIKDFGFEQEKLSNNNIDLLGLENVKLLKSL